MTVEAAASQAAAKCIIRAFPRNLEIIMDAEQLNAIANRLTDLSARTTDLRRYL